MSDTFNTVVSTLTMYASLFKAIQNDQGLEKALELHGIVMKPFGDGMAEMFKQGLDGKEPNMKVFKKAVMEPVMASYGYVTEMEATDKKLTMTVEQCPMYNAFDAADIDSETIGKICRAGFASEYGRINDFYPTVFASINPRKSSDDVCVETVEIK